MGRHSDYTQEMADAICEKIASGESVRAICKPDDMPAMSTVFRWLSNSKEFSEQYARSKQAQAEYMVDEILDIADDGTNDWMEKRSKDGDMLGWVENGEALRRSVLRVDARKWLAMKLLPKKYGEKLDVNATHAGEIAVRRVVTDL